MNLLPPAQKEVIHKEMLFKFYFAALATFSFLGIVFLVLLYSINLYLSIQIPALEKRIEIEKSSETSRAYGTVEQKIAELNASLAQIDVIRGKGFVDAGAILRKAGAMLPEGAYFTTLSYQGDVLSIAGRADTREQALSLKEALEKDSICVSLTSPLLVRQINVDFTFVCNLRDVIIEQELEPVPDGDEDIYE